jgi:hypothetical protein
MGRALLLIFVLTIATIGCGNNSLVSEEDLVPEEARKALVGNWRGEKQSPYQMILHFGEDGNYSGFWPSAGSGLSVIPGTYSVSNNVITVVATDSLRTSDSTSIVPGKVYSATFTISRPPHKLMLQNSADGALQTPMLPSGTYDLIGPMPPGPIGGG